MTAPSFNIQHLIEAAPSDEEKDLLKVFPEIVKSLTVWMTGGDSDLMDCQQHLQEVLEYNVPHGRNAVALLLMKSYRELTKQVSEEELKVIRVVAWCYQMQHIAYRMVDEMIFDRAVNKEGRPCYHRVTGTDLEVSNDACWIESCCYMLLQNYVKDHKMLKTVEPLFRSNSKKKVTGQNLFQETIHPQGTVDFSAFTHETYDTYVKYSISSPLIFGPVHFTMHWVGRNDANDLQQMKNICLKLGHFYQVKEDYLNCYGSKEVHGKSGSNIALNRMCWLIVTALGLANDQQKETLKANYGRPDKTCIDKVKAVYDQLDITSAFRKLENKSHLDLTREITNLRDDLPKQFLMETANNILNWEDTLYFL